MLLLLELGHLPAADVFTLGQQLGPPGGPLLLIPPQRLFVRVASVVLTPLLKLLLPIGKLHVKLLQVLVIRLVKLRLSSSWCFCCGWCPSPPSLGCVAASAILILSLASASSSGGRWRVVHAALAHVRHLPALGRLSVLVPAWPVVGGRHAAVHPARGKVCPALILLPGIASRWLATLLVHAAAAVAVGGGGGRGGGCAAAVAVAAVNAVGSTALSVCVGTVGSAGGAGGGCHILGGGGGAGGSGGGGLVDSSNGVSLPGTSWLGLGPHPAPPGWLHGGWGWPQQPRGIVLPAGCVFGLWCLHLLGRGGLDAWQQGGHGSRHGAQQPVLRGRWGRVLGCRLQCCFLLLHLLWRGWGWGLLGWGWRGLIPCWGVTRRRAWWRAWGQGGSHRWGGDAHEGHVVPVHPVHAVHPCLPPHPGVC